MSIVDAFIIVQITLRAIIALALTRVALRQPRRAERLRNTVSRRRHPRPSRTRSP